ncbi:zf-CCHC domain-containing protein [Tanacetum coccineum]
MKKLQKQWGEPTMEEYMTKTREDYGSGIARPNFDEKAHFELKGQFLKEIRDNTFSGSDNEDANEHIEKLVRLILGKLLRRNFLSKYCPPAQTAKRMEEINKFQQEPDETLYQAWERFKELLLRCPQHYIMNMQEVILFYKGLDVPTRQILDSKGVIPSMKAANAKKAIYDMAEHSQKWHNETSTRTRRGRYRADAPGFYQRDNENPSYQERRQIIEESLSKFMAKYAKRHDENSNLIKKSRASTDVAIRNQGASIKALEIQIRKISKNNKRPNGISEYVLSGIDKFVFLVDFIVLDMPEDIKVHLILERPFVSTAHAKIDVFKRKITLRVGDDKIVFRSDNPTNNIIKRVFALGLRE